MLKFSLVLLFCVLSLFAQESDKVEVYANTMDSKGSIVEANGEVIVVYKDYFLSAKRARYDKTTGELELFENVRANNAGVYKLLGSYAKLNIAKKERTFRPFYMLDNESRVWLSGDEGCAYDKDIEIDSGVMSGCDPKDPLWKMEFSSSEYNTDTKWLSLYNARIYIYDIPVLYTPYIGYSLDTTRRTGLLIPTFGISDKEGFYYEQALYIAEQNWWDLELKPQVRTNRGEGLYSEFRFVDSAVSKGSLRGGYFQEKAAYALDNELLYDKHHGFNLEYDNKDLLNQWFGTSFLGQSGLYVDISDMSDVDYLNLTSNNALNNVTSRQILSRINLFYNTQSDYFGAYFKYYKDLMIDNNENTLQKLPTLHYHHYLDTLFKDHLLYNIDVQANHVYREINKKVVQTNINAPITLQTALFDEYLNLAYTSQNYAQHSAFSGEETRVDSQYDNGIYASNTNRFRASTLLTKAFENNTHVLDFGLTYTTAGTEYRSGFYEDYEYFCKKDENKNKPECEFYNITDTKESLKIDFAQFLFDSLGNQKIYHRLAQSISYDQGSTLGELENELDYKVSDSISFYNNMFYNYDEKAFSKVLNRIGFTQEGLNFSLSHLYRDTFLQETQTYSPYTSYLTSTLRYTYNDNYSYHASIDYDLETKMKKSSKIGFMYRKRCWDFGLSFVENTRPILTRDALSSSLHDRFLMISIVLKPLMKSGEATSDFALRLPENLEGN